MNKKVLSVLLLISLMSAVSCEAVPEEVQSSETVSLSSDETVPESSSEATSVSSTEETAAVTEETWPDDVYVPFASGHGFSLVEEGYGTEVTDQASGTCWAHAAATALESNFLYVQGVSVDVDPTDIVDATYGTIAHPDPDREGFHPRLYSALNVGAGPLQTIAGLATGIEGGVVLTEALDFDGLSREQLQEVLRTYGAFTIAYADRSNDYNDIYGFTTLNNHNTDADHSVTLVGWDDDFPGEYFDPPAEENGAWLVQNSFSDRWGNGGYFWLSYETGFVEPFSFEGSTCYSHVCSYGSCTGSVSTGDVTSVASVFEYEGSLGAVGTYTPEPGQEITVEIYDGILEDGELLYSATEEFEYRGYHTIELPESLDVSTFTVIIRYRSEAPVEGESTESFYGDSYIAYVASSEPGESYVLIDYEWVDLSSDDISGLLNIDFIPNNASINALFY